MVIGKPEAASTPTTVPLVRGRRSVRDHSSFQSPIDCPNEVSNSPPSYSKKSPRHVKRIKSRSHSPGGDSVETENGSSGNELSEETRESSNRDTTPRNGWIVPACLILALVAIVGGWVGNLICCSEHSTSHQELNAKFARFEKQFNKQDEDFWRSIRVNIEDINAFRKPSTIIFVYENDAKDTMKQVLRIVSNIAVCYLTDCKNEPTFISASTLRSLHNAEDYGTIISTYREPLTNNGVLIVENLELVPGKAAQAFHSFCDENDPVVDKALILFTLKVDKLPPNELATSYVRKVLSQIWSDINLDDKFNPLFARISGTVLLVRPE